ncbi:MAG: hypothetical protein WBB76_08570 [Gaiellaceae bacterium]
MAIAIVAGLFYAFGHKSSSAPKVDQSKLVGLQTGPAPWNAGVDYLPNRMQPLGLHQLGSEGQGVILHIHAHLDIFVNRKKEPVPAGIGIFNATGGFLTDLHTHTTGGVIHIESPAHRTFSLGEFFGVWGVRLTRTCVGGYCKPATPWRLYVNGAPYTGDPTQLVLKKHQELAIIVGKPPKKIPSTYAFHGL